MKTIIYIILLITIVITACTKTTQDIESSLDVPVVESFLSPGSEAVVRLTTAIPYTIDTTLEVGSDISGVGVYLTTNDITYLLTELSDSAGYYKDGSGELVVAENQNYQLAFQYNGNTISSSTTIPIKPENFESSETTIETEKITEDGGWGGPPDMTEIELTWDDENNDYYLIYIQYLEDEYDTINEVIEIEDASELANFSSPPMQDNVYTIRSMQFMFFGEYRIVLCRITEEYAQLYETLSQSSLEGLTEPPTNVVNGKGIFTGFNSDTLFINVVEE